MSRRKAKCLVVVSLLLLGAVVAGCAQAAMAPGESMPVEQVIVVEREMVMEEAAEAPAAADSGYGGGVNASGIERLIIRNASLGVVVKDTEEALDQITQLVNGMGGFIVESNVYQYQEGMQASVRLRVPAEKFDAALNSIRDLATEVRSENVSGQDVTEEYVDLSSRLRSLEATEEKLLEFMEEAEDTEAALAVLEQLQAVQADIEHVKGRKKFLEDSAAMATIALDITPDKLAQPIEVGGWHPEGTLRDSVEGLVRILQWLVDAAIVIVVLVMPVLTVIAVPFVVLFFIVRAIVRRRRVRRARRTQTTETETSEGASE